jgi:cytoskeletal protein CcmA (bactofilin family)
MARTIISVLTGQRDEESVPGKSSDSSDEAAAAMAEGLLAADRSVMTLGKMLTFKGELSADEDMVLLGRVEGSITHTESLTVGVGGVVIGNVRARVITIKGTVEGDLNASDSITITPTANVTGDLVAPRISIVEGAIFNGSARMSSPAVAEAKVSVPRTESTVLAPATAVAPIGKTG